MQYRKINVELVVEAEETVAVVADINDALDRIEEKRALFGGDIQIAPVRHPSRRKRSAFAHTTAAGETVTDALRVTCDGLASALHAVFSRL